MEPTTTKTKTYWSASLRRAVTIPDDDERHRIDELLQATGDLLAAIRLTGVQPSDQNALLVWQQVVERAALATAAFRK